MKDFFNFYICRVVFIIVLNKICLVVRLWFLHHMIAYVFLLNVAGPIKWRTSSSPNINDDASLHVHPVYLVTSMAMEGERLYF